MTLLPCAPRLIGKAPEGLPDYEPIYFNPHERGPSPENRYERHHVVRRSFTKKSAWVTVDGQVWQNEIYLTRADHREVTENRAMLFYDETLRSWAWHEKQDGEWHHVADIPLPSLTEGDRPDTCAEREAAEPQASTGTGVPARNSSEVMPPSPSVSDAQAPSEAQDEHECHATCECGQELRKAPKRPYVKKTDVPTGFVRVQGPQTDVENMNKRIDELVLRAGLSDRKFARFKALDMALILIDTPEINVTAIREQIDEQAGWAA